MTALLEKAFAEASKLSAPEQDFLAARLLAELSPEDTFDQAIESNPTALRKLALSALHENAAGETMPLDPKRL